MELRAVRYVDDVNDNANSKVSKSALRAGTVTAASALMMLVSLPAFAVNPDDGDDPGPGLSVAETLGLYVALPVAIFLAISALVMLGGRTGSGKQQR
ncbi:hypothetical protein H180DRAFT_01279 [Streptomyces sp. WMMB 322]|nr:hypothetical protein H180DRAFT_01279 [Streptomyces sp. WMMB 322]